MWYLINNSKLLSENHSPPKKCKSPFFDNIENLGGHYATTINKDHKQRSYACFLKELKLQICLWASKCSLTVQIA